MTESTHNIDLQKYFERIGYYNKPTLDLDTLKSILTQHIRTLPFENVTSFLGSPVNIDLAAIEQKLVNQKRGGYCFEQNALLRAVLQQIGFTVTGLAARVLWQTPPGHQPAQSHMILLVEVGQVHYLLDAGFGSNTLTAPIRLDVSDPQGTPHGTYRLTLSDEDYLLEVKVADSWQPMYSFDLRPRNAGDYKIANWFCCTHPESRFVEHLIATRAFTEGRHALLDRQLSYQPIAGPKTVIMLASVEELRKTLLEVFGIETPREAGADQKLANLFKVATSSESCGHSIANIDQAAS
ncbi:arylamine N-acetyltransferase [Microbulbifer sp. THAF38]|uniref:arylamine N-acetyltransferase family protein n=1 Tax=Microbulbifer sp. THAF38 TaxID=2587856 RepID=UPI0012687DA8|nr:arylamine N-acetyltransferase [Microbulbifer sp. THAF38]QFT54735.1 Arylamine N-acetyltransferase [Microbulbifer sp. THAF38]